MMLMMEEALECYQYLPKGRKILFYVQTNLHKIPEPLQKEIADPALEGTVI